jgi:CheY-like chemotaxis protein
MYTPSGKGYCPVTFSACIILQSARSRKLARDPTFLTKALFYAIIDGRGEIYETVAVRKARRMAQKILIVEDSSDISRLVRHILAQAGYEVLVAEDGPAGWEAFERIHPDLALLDVNLPGLDGIELCRRIKQASPTTPVIILTVQAESEAVQRGLRAGANTYLAKPFEIAQLMAAINYALRPPIRRLGEKKGEEGGAQSLDY